MSACFLQAALRAVTPALQMPELLSGGDSPPVELGSQQRSAVPIVVELGLEGLDLPERCHAENSEIE